MSDPLEQRLDSERAFAVPLRDAEHLADGLQPDYTARTGAPMIRADTLRRVLDGRTPATPFEGAEDRIRDAFSVHPQAVRSFDALDGEDALVPALQRRAEAIIEGEEPIEGRALGWLLERDDIDGETRHVEYRRAEAYSSSPDGPARVPKVFDPGDVRHLFKEYLKQLLIRQSFTSVEDIGVPAKSEESSLQRVERAGLPTLLGDSPYFDADGA